MTQIVAETVKAGEQGTSGGELLPVAHCPDDGPVEVYASQHTHLHFSPDEGYVVLDRIH